MVNPPQVVRALHAEAALVADESAQNERAGDEEPQDRGVEYCVEEQAGPYRGKWQIDFI